MASALSSFFSHNRGLVIFAIILFFVLIPHVTFADPACANDDYVCIGAQGGTTPPATAPNTPASPPPAATPQSSGGCNVFTGFNINDCVGDLLGNITDAVLSLVNIITGLAGTLLNYAIVMLVFEFPKYFGNSAGLLAGWSMLRDIGNIILLFGFIWIGVQTILNINHFSVGKALPRLIIFAVLLNFSLFAAEAVIDGTNLFAATIYKQAATPCPTEANWLDCAKQQGIAGTVFSQSGISSMLSAKASASSDHYQHFYLNVLFIVFSVFLGFVLFAGAFLLIARGVILAFLMITSPIGFAGMAIPQMNKLAEQWWHALISNAFVAPVFLLLVVVSLKMLEGMSKLMVGSVNADLTNIVTSGGIAGIFGNLLVFVLVIGFLLASVKVASDMGAFGATWATKTAGNLSFGTLGFVGRRTIGAQTYNMGQNLRKTQFARSGMGRLVVGGLDTFGKASYDARGASVAKAFNKNLGLNIDAGKEQKGGYEHVVHEGEKKLDAYGRSLKLTEQEKTDNQRAKDAIGEEQELAKKREETEKKVTEKEVEVENEKLKMLRIGEEETIKEETNAQVAWTTEEKAIQALETKRDSDEAIAQTTIEAQERKVAATISPALQKIEANKLAGLKRAQTDAADAADLVIKGRKEELTKEKDFYTNARKQFTDDQKASVARIASIREAGNKRVETIRTESTKKVTELKKIETITRQVNNPQMQLAKKLREELKGNWVLRRTAAPQVYEHALHKLEEWSGKSSSERALGELTDAIKKGAGGGDEHKARAAVKAITPKDDHAHDAEDKHDH